MYCAGDGGVRGAASGVPQPAQYDAPKAAGRPQRPQAGAGMRGGAETSDETTVSDHICGAPDVTSYGVWPAAAACGAMSGVARSSSSVCMSSPIRVRANLQ